MPDPTSLNHRLALALGWTPHPDLGGYYLSRAGMPETWGVRDITPPDYLSGDGMLVVLEEMRARGWECELTLYVEKGAAAWFHRPGDAASLRSAMAATLPEAVAEAVLEALEGA